MASVLARLDVTAPLVPGSVLPIDRYLTEERSFATELSRGGSLYLVAIEGDTPWLIAVLEAPESSGIKRGDQRAPGWYAPPNDTPITDLAPLHRQLKLGKDLAKALAHPRILTRAQEHALRELLDAIDPPVIEHVEHAAPAPALDPAWPPLERAARYLADGHVVAAITALAEAWRTSRVPAIADLIDRATRLLPSYHRPLTDQRVAWGDAQASRIWNAAFEADPQAAMPQLLLNLATGGGSLIPERTRKLAELPLDPRFGARLVELLASRPTWSDNRWWAPVVEMWIASRDVRIAESLLELERAGETFGAATEALYEIARAPAPTLSSADMPVVARLSAELARREEPERIECALVDQLANAGDPGPYQVYADWLIERGRPLGEYLALCLIPRDALSPAQARRLAILGEVPYLCGAFDDLPAIRLRHRPRGIDRELTVYGSTQPRSWRLFAACPLVRALRRVELVGMLGDDREAALADFVRAAPALERLGNLPLGVARLLANALPGWIVEPRDPYGLEDDGDLERAWSGDLVRATRADRSR